MKTIKERIEERDARRQEKLNKEREKEELRLQREEQKKDLDAQKLLKLRSGELNAQQKAFIYIEFSVKAAMPLIIYMLIPALIIALGRQLWGASSMDTEVYYEQISNFAVFAGTILVLRFFYKSAKKRGTTVGEEATVSFKGVKPLYLLGMFVFGFLSAVFISSVYTLLPEALVGAYDAQAAKPYNGYDFPLLFIAMVILAPVAEELIYRGYMLNRTILLFGEKGGIIFVTILFAITHVSLLWGIYAVVMGYIFAKVAIRHDNTMYSIFMHIGFNLPSVITKMISMDPVKNDMLFGHWYQIVLYGAISVIGAYMLWDYYKKKELL